jgi:hypothetical protein
MNPAQLLNPKAFAKEKAKAAKRTPNYGMFTISFFHWVFSSYSHLDICFHTPLHRPVTLVACDDRCLDSGSRM